jgi:EAL domain-containing protein (putative c-di-GMP-specific phosphodiesterase class I)
MEKRRKHTGRIAVNVSTLPTARQKDFVTIVEEATGPSDGDIGIDIEITETMLMHDITHSLSVLGAIRKLGVMIAIDDFGTGYSLSATLRGCRSLSQDRPVLHQQIVDQTATWRSLRHHFMANSLNLSHRRKA